jgi:hypothetical protein
MCTKKWKDFTLNFVFWPYNILNSFHGKDVENVPYQRHPPENGRFVFGFVLTLARSSKPSLLGATNKAEYRCLLSR